MKPTGPPARGESRPGDGASGDPREPGAGDTIVRALHVFTDSSTSPVLVECADGALRVAKLSGAGPGPAGLLVELLATRVAAAHGVPVPAVRPLRLPADLPWQVGTDEFDDALRRSHGWNLGIDFVPDARAGTARDLADASPGVALAIALSDRFLANVDRTVANPNALVDGRGELWCIDHGACLFLDRALAGRGSRAALPASHPLAHLPLPNLARGPELDWAALLHDVPCAWQEAVGSDAAGLAAALARYERGFRAEATG